ncbi:hypothetical protein [Paraburkholderia tagetis]|uniref:Uncharacterized protein n=1 Tax=Paraburkholderia tagetis TaxID=2913261 RepID=A0A9X1ULS4_9BURK|nr:hypothetical protein [Paraburkholderia tagetis]MCG5077727.1 hypothetical protein [Paraburkholderia tagetis]
MNQPAQHTSLDIVVDGEHDIGLPRRARVGKRARVAVIVVALMLGAGATRTIGTIVSNVMGARHLAEVTKQNGPQYCSAGPCREALAGAARRGG